MTDLELADRRTHRWIMVCLALLTSVVYARVVLWGYIPFDDPAYVQENPRVWAGLTLDNIRWAFTTTTLANWHPLTWLSYMLDCQLVGPRAGWFHFVNLALHVVDTVLLYVVLRRMTGATRAAAFVALLFALHPLHVESVAWIAERKDVLSTLFWILCMAAYTGYARAPSVGRYLLTAIWLALGLMTKPMLVTLPCVLLLLDYWPLDRFATLASEGRSKFRVALRLFVEKLPLFGLSAASSWITAAAQYHDGAVSDLQTFSLATRAANAAITYVSYLGKTFWPTKLAAYYPHAAFSPPDFEPSARFYELGCYAGAMLAVVSLLVFWFGRDRKYLTVGWLWYLGTLVPVIGLVQVGLQGMADRYTYVPLIGIFIMVAWGVPDLLGRVAAPARRFCLDLGALVCVSVCVLLTWMQVGHWQSGIALFTHTLAVTETNVRGQTLLALSYIRAGEFAKAVELYESAVKLDPNNSRTLNHLGVALLGMQRPDEAVTRIRQSIALDPNLASSHLNCALALAAQEKHEEAIVEFREALRLEPTMAKSHNSLGISLAKLKRFDEAAEHYNEALRLNPWLRGAQQNLEMANARLPFPAEPPASQAGKKP